MGQFTLRISIEPKTETIAIILEGRVAGPWAIELSRTWIELAPSVGERKLSIDLCNTTYADEIGIRILRAIYTSTSAQLVTSTPWTKYLAEEVTREPVNENVEEL